MKQENYMKTQRDCFCALCRTPRKLRYARHLSSQHYLQIISLTIVLSAVAYPWLGFKGPIAFPVVWMLFEGIHKSLYRRDLKCPFCGFDPTWYKKDVKLARQKVEEFLKQNPTSPILQRVQKEESAFKHQ
jgi:hypothetical protein